MSKKKQVSDKPQTYWIDFGRRLRRRREKLELTQQGLGALCDPPMSGGHISNMERAFAVPRANTRKRVMYALSVLEGSPSARDEKPSSEPRRLAVVKPGQPSRGPYKRSEAVYKSGIHPALLTVLGTCGDDATLRLTVSGLRFEVRCLGSETT